MVRPPIVSRIGFRARSLTLRYADAPLHITAGGPTDVRQRISQTSLRTCIDSDFHLAALESGRRPFLGLLRQKPYVHQFRGRPVDLARLAKRFLQNAHRLAHIVGGNPWHRAYRISGSAATDQHDRTQNPWRSTETQHNPDSMQTFGVASLALRRGASPSLTSQNRNLRRVRAAYVNAIHASCRAADPRRDARRQPMSGGGASGAPAIASSARVAWGRAP